jgi:maltose alpha-D-glucosyltransferase/alpha-amylase
MDFMLDWYGNGYNCIARYYDLDESGNITADRSYFKNTSSADISGFLRDYLPQYEETKDAGLRCLITGNHDTKRVSFNLDDTERKLLFAFLLTMPGAPFIYYGDEIGMAYRWLPTKEGGYHRTGSRTPMQWDDGKNLGFSEGNTPYLPADPNPGSATVAAQEKDPDSMLNFVRSLTALRRENEDLGNYAPFSVFSAEEGSRLFAYKRGKLLLAVNPGQQALTLTADGDYDLLFAYGNVEVQGEAVQLSAQSFAVLQPKV